MSHPLISHIFVLSLAFLLNRIHENRVANTEIQCSEQASFEMSEKSLLVVVTIHCAIPARKPYGHCTHRVTVLPQDSVHERATHCPWASFQHGRQILAVLAIAWAAFGFVPPLRTESFPRLCSPCVPTLSVSTARLSSD